MIKNILVKKILTIILISVFSIAVIIFGIYTVVNSAKNIAFLLDSDKPITEYSDIILTSYEDYQTLVDDYGIEDVLSKSKFNKNYYLASFQEYSDCTEKKFKTVKNVDVADTLKITYKVYNKCGFCKNKVTLHLIKIEKVDPNIKIEYDYVYNSKLNCGSI